jgi:uncharacterized protein YijF (DUF1287 family)
MPDYDSLQKVIAQIIYPCNWGGDFHRCKGFCSDYSVQKHKKQTTDVMDAVKAFVEDMNEH